MITVIGWLFGIVLCAVAAVGFLMAVCLIIILLIGIQDLVDQLLN